MYFNTQITKTKTNLGHYCFQEEYIASGPSIKKAQHAAAAMALEKTQFKHPTPKVKHSKSGIDSENKICQPIFLIVCMKRSFIDIYNLKKQWF